MDTSEQSFTIKDEIYPYLLRQIYNPPQKLYYRGNLNILNKTCIAIVGTRKSSEYGEMLTGKIIEELSNHDICIVSGLASGIDTIAHTEALKNNLSTIAVLGSGINNIYPKSNVHLSKEILKNNLILSEYEGITEAINYQFPARNRIISGLSIATLVVEAPESSGALITAKYALDQGREIFTIPGDIDRENSIGSLKLLQNCAAYPVSSGREIIDILKKQPHLFELKDSQNSQISATPSPKKSSSPPLKLTKNESVIMASLSRRKSISVSDIHQKTTLPIDQLLSTLSLLEIRGLVSFTDEKYTKIC